MSAMMPSDPGLFEGGVRRKDCVRQDAERGRLEACAPEASEQRRTGLRSVALLKDGPQGPVATTRLIRNWAYSEK